jgi:DNA recombination-dependent growth factor C
MDRMQLQTPKEDPVSDLTRRGFVKNAAVTAAGMTGIGAIAADAASADGGAGGSEPVVAYVSDQSKGEISVMKGEREVKLRDRKLARDISRAAR